MTWLTKIRAAYPAIILAASAVSAPGAHAAPDVAPGAAHGVDRCLECRPVETLAERFEARAAVLASRAANAAQVAARAADPAQKVWPAPDGAGIAAPDTSFWLGDMAEQAHMHRAQVAQEAAAAVAGMAARFDDAATRCAQSGYCRASAPPDIAASSRSASASGTTRHCAAFAPGDGNALARLTRHVAALERHNAQCRGTACPVADCARQSALMEEVAFTRSILAAAAGPQPADASIAGGPRAGQAPAGGNTGKNALDALASIADAIGHAEIDREGLRMAAAALATAEAALLAQEPQTGQADISAPRSAWRAMAARFALAAVRDRLGQIQLAAADGSDMRLLPGLADRMASAALAMMRHGRPVAPPPPVGFCAADAARLGALHRRIQAALEGAAACGVRAGCDVHEAVTRGEARARQLVSTPVLPETLELVRAIEEEADIGVDAASVQDAVAPRIDAAITRAMAGEVIEARIDPRGNRCLADGGYVALEPAGTHAERAEGMSALSSLMRETLTAGDPQASVLFEAPAPGDYSLNVYAAAGAGGALLAQRPVVVTKPAPARCDGWTGVWRTEFGRLVTVERAGGTVTGTYRQGSAVRPGFLTGRVSGDTLRGTWMSEIGTGGTRLTLRGEGLFRGTWGLAPGRETNGGIWSGICIARGLDGK